ncbi:MAG: SIMPL domain-containing protein [Pseudomonadota bacterium]
MRLLLLASLLLIPFPAAAQMQDPILTLPDGQVILNISATERREVEQDLLVANLQYSAEGAKARDIQNEVNESMAKAVKEAKKVDEVKINTGAYNVYERTEPRTKERKWYARQTLTLKSKDSEAVLTLAGKLQDMGLKMNGLNYMLDPKTAVSVQDSLLEDAVKQMQTRADRVAKAMGKSSAEIKELNTQSAVPYPRPMYAARGMAMAMEADAMAAPVAEAGEDTITMTVNGRVILKP